MNITSVLPNIKKTHLEVGGETDIKEEKDGDITITSSEETTTASTGNIIYTASNCAQCVYSTTSTGNISFILLQIVLSVSIPLLLQVTSFILLQIVRNVYIPPLLQVTSFILLQIVPSVYLFHLFYM